MPKALQVVVAMAEQPEEHLQAVLVAKARAHQDRALAHQPVVVKVRVQQAEKNPLVAQPTGVWPLPERTRKS